MKPRGPDGTRPRPRARRIPETLATFEPLVWEPRHSIQLRVVRWDIGERQPRVDLRRYVQSLRHSGATLKGVSLTEEQFRKLLAQAPLVLEVLARAKELPPLEPGTLAEWRPDLERYA